MTITPETIAELRRLHTVTCEHDGDNCQHLPGCTLAICAECGDTWPCATSALLEFVEQSQTYYAEILDKGVRQKLRALSAERERDELRAIVARVRALPRFSMGTGDPEIPPTTCVFGEDIDAALDPNGDQL